MNALDLLAEKVIRNLVPVEKDCSGDALLAQISSGVGPINYKKDGRPFWLDLAMASVTSGAERAPYWVAVGRDVTQRKAVEHSIQRLAYFDPLTQLPNRLVLMERLKLALRPRAGRQGAGALLFIDLDNFKTLNDVLGYDKGDLLLQQVAQRLAASVGPRDIVARLGGDEFVVMLEELGADPVIATEDALTAAEKIRLALSAPYQLCDVEHRSTCSIGVTAFGSRDDCSVGDSLKEADLAMYQAKMRGRDRVCLYDPALRATAAAQATLNADLHEGLRNNDFVLYYQPQVDHLGRVSGVEALVRWLHPKRGLVEPDEFIPAAEETGLILPLGLWVLEAVGNQLAAWAHCPQFSHLSIAVNVSVRQFRHPGFVDQVVTTIRNAGVPAQRLKLELTESLLATGMDITIASLGVLKDMGITLALDDFGVGYSALSTLKRIPIDQIKIDKIFVKDILTDPDDAAITRAIISMAKSLGLGVIAEGVQNAAQRDFLASSGCHCYQGFLFCAPLPILELEAFLTRDGAEVPHSESRRQGSAERSRSNR